MAPAPREGGGGELGNVMEVGDSPGVRNWMLETACLRTIGTLKAGLDPGDSELNEIGLVGLGKEVTEADKGSLGLSTVRPADGSLLTLFCGSERGDGLWTARPMVFGRREEIGRGGSSDSALGWDLPF